MTKFYFTESQSFVEYSPKYIFTPRTRVCAIYRTPLGCYENLIRSDLFIYHSHRGVLI